MLKGRSQVLLLFGGESTEHDVSIMSARNVSQAIDRNRFDVLLGYIDRNGQWHLLENLDQYTNPSDFTELTPLLGQSSFLAGDRILRPEVILPILHGKNGEDGSVQGLAQLLHIPIVGCDMTASAIGMDKVTAKRVASAIGINIVPYAVYRRGDPIATIDTLWELGDILFVKPSRAGSSVGVSKVTAAGDLQRAIDAALVIDDTVLVEKAVEVRELEVAILGIPPQHKASRVGEVVPGEDFYNYDDKYSEASASSIRIPADISDAIEQEIRRQAQLLFVEFGASSMARIDFFLTGDGSIYFNEINTLPGFTDISMYPKLWENEGVAYSQLITRLIDDAILKA